MCLNTKCSCSLHPIHSKHETTECGGHCCARGVVLRCEDPAVYRCCAAHRAAPPGAATSSPPARRAEAIPSQPQQHWGGYVGVLGFTSGASSCNSHVKSSACSESSPKVWTWIQPSWKPQGENFLGKQDVQRELSAHFLHLLGQAQQAV